MPSSNPPGSPSTNDPLAKMERGDGSSAPRQNYHNALHSSANKSETHDQSVHNDLASTWINAFLTPFLASLNRVTFAFTGDDDNQARNQQDAASLDEGDTATNVKEVEGQGWQKVYEELKKYDEGWIKRRSDHIGDLQIFAGLFSAVLTPFLVEIYVELQPDNTQLSAPILVDLSRQLHSISLGQVAPITSVPLTPSDPSKRLTTVASLWFLSLVLSLGSALFGLLVKQWYHEYIRWITIFPVQHAVRVRQCRYNSLKSWRSHTMLSVMTVFLEVALALFFVGLALLLWEVNELAAKVITTAICIILSIAISCTVLPAILPSLPYRTFLGSSLLHVARFIRKLSAKSLIVLIRFFGSPDSEVAVASIKYVGHNPFKRAQEGLQRLLTAPTFFLKASSVHYWKDYDSWAKLDMLHRLDHTPEKTAADQANILVWLFTHAGCHLTNNLIEKCISDASDVPPAHLSWKEEKNNRWVTSGLERTRQNFTMPYLSFCTFLYGMMKTNKSLPKGFDKYQNFNAIMDELFPKSLVADGFGGSALHSQIAFNEKSISRLSKSIQELDRKLEHKLLDYFVSFIETFFKWQSSDSSLSKLRTQGQDVLNIITEILRILVLFRFRMDSSSELESTFSPHWLSQNRFGERISECLKSGFERVVGEDLDKLELPGNGQTDTELMALRAQAEDNCDRAVTSLAIGISHSFLDDMYSEKEQPNGIVIKNIMLTATRFIYSYALPLSSSDQSNSNKTIDAITAQGGERKRFPSARTRVFWNIADHIFRYHAQLEAPVQDSISDMDRFRHGSFLGAIEEAIQIEMGVRSRWEQKSASNPKIKPSYLCDMPAYLLRYRSLLPSHNSAARGMPKDLRDTLKLADNDCVINIQDMLDGASPGLGLKSSDSKSLDTKSPDPIPSSDLKGLDSNSLDPNDSPSPARVRTKLGLWRLLENPDTTIRGDD